MPIRDMDSYGAPRGIPSTEAASSSSMPSHTRGNGTGLPVTSFSPAAAAASPSQGRVLGSAGVPVASNRGASGIDGVLSTAAGFAAGLRRGVTLVVGDISFLHDINGLNLLRAGLFRVG